MRVKEVCELINGRSFKPSDWGTIGVPIVRIQNLNDESAAFNYFAGSYDPMHEVNNGELLFSWSGTPGTSFGAFRWYRGKGVLNQHIFKVIPRIAIDKDYLMYALNGNLQTIISKAHGGVGLQHITKKELDEIEISVPGINTQREIVATISLAREMIAKRQRQLCALDTLIKARFVEMFGDPVNNPLGWEQVTLKDVAKGKLSYGSGASATDFDGNLRYIRITDITESGDLNNDRKSPDQFDEKYLLSDGDILFARSGATVGKTFCYAEKKHGKAIYAGYLIRMIPDTSKVLPVYVFYYTKTEYYASFVANAQRAVAQPNINAQEYGDLKICVPPMELQKQFSAFVSQVDKSKVVVQQALDKAQMFIDSLMQQYFG